MRASYSRFNIFLALCTILLLITLVAAGRDFYKILGVNRGATPKQIKKAFHKASLKYHPDHNQNNEAAQKKYMEINEAYDILSDDKKKKIFDQYGEEGINRDAQGNPPGGGGGHPFGGGGNPFGGFGPFGGGGGGGSFHFGGGDPFAQFFGGGGRRQQQQQHHRQQQQQQPAKPLYEGDAKVVELSDQNWPFLRTETEEDKDQIWLIKFYSDQCQACHNASPAWKAVAAEMKPFVNVGAINCRKHTHICQQQKIEQYPTIKLFPFREHSHPRSFDKQVNKAELLQFITSNTPTFLPVLTGDKIDGHVAKQAKYKPLVVLILSPQKTPLVSPTLLALSKALRDQFTFVALANEPQDDRFVSYVEQLGHKVLPPSHEKPQVFLRTPFQTLHYTNALTYSQLSDYLNTLSGDFKQKKFYDKAFTTFMKETKLALKLTPALFRKLSHPQVASPKYLPTIVTCPQLITPLTTTRPTPDAPRNAQRLAANTMTLSATAQYFRSNILNKSPQQVYLVDVTNAAMMSTINAMTDNAFAQELSAIQQYCATKVQNDHTPTIITQNIAFALGINYKRNKYTTNSFMQQVQDGVLAQHEHNEFVNNLPLFIENNESPSNTKMFPRDLSTRVKHDEL